MHRSQALQYYKFRDGLPTLPSTECYTDQQIMRNVMFNRFSLFFFSLSFFLKIFLIIIFPLVSAYSLLTYLLFTWIYNGKCTLQRCTIDTFPDVAV